MLAASATRHTGASWQAGREGMAALPLSARTREPARAIAAHLEVLRRRPADHRALHGLLELLVAGERWRDVVTVLRRFVALESGRDEGARHRRARYLVAAGNVCRDKLGDDDGAIGYYDQALDHDGRDFKTFERIDRLLVARGAWRRQERHTMRMIQRLSDARTPEERRALLALVQRLGEIYRTRLLDPRAAIATYEVAVDLDPSSLWCHQILAALYLRLGIDHADQAARHLACVCKIAGAGPAGLAARQALVRLHAAGERGRGRPTAA